MTEVPERLAAILDAFDARHALGAHVADDGGALFLGDERFPRVYDANHARRVLTADADLPRLFDEIERRYAHLHFRSVRSDARCATSLEARLSVAGYAPSLGEVLLTLEDDVRGCAANVRIAEIASEADWRAWRSVKAQDQKSPWFAEIGDEWVAYTRRRSPAAAYFGAFDGDALLAFFSVFVHERVGYLEDLLVAPAARNRGVGTALVRFCSEEARRRGARLVFLPAAIDDTPRAMYAAMGFTPVGMAWHWLRRDED